MVAVLRFTPPCPAPEDVGIKTPTHIDKQLFQTGLEHGLKSNELICFKASFRAGFREAKLYLRQVQRNQGVLEWPKKIRFSTRL